MLSLIIRESYGRQKFPPIDKLERPVECFCADDSNEEREKKSLLNRLETLWTILKPSDPLKLEFKFIIQV
jgi:hypothetical protein